MRLRNHCRCHETTPVGPCWLTWADRCSYVRTAIKKRACLIAIVVFGASASTVAADVVCPNENEAVSPTTSTASFVFHLNGTVTDVHTGLTWMRCSVGQNWSGSECLGQPETYTWFNALSVAETVSFGGLSQWRVPNIKELRTIVEQSCWEPAVNQAVFPGVIGDWYFSSSPAIGDVNQFGNFDGLHAWGVDFSRGLAFGGLGKTSRYQLILVRETVD